MIPQWRLLEVRMDVIINLWLDGFTAINLGLQL